MRVRLQRALNRPLVLAVIGIGLGATLAIWLFLSFSSFPVSNPLQLSATATPSGQDAPQAPASAPEPTLVAVEPAVVASPEEPSPFAGIAAPPPVPPRRPGMVTHVVQPDEVLWQIAEQYGLRAETILWANDIPDPDLLLVGQKLQIPPEDGVVYTVRPGDSLADIATRYGVDVDAVAFPAAPVGGAPPPRPAARPR